MDKRFLIVEDEIKIADSIGRAVRCVARPLITHTVASAVEHSSNESWVGAIIDLGLPDGTGFEVLSYIQAHDPSMPALMLTGRSDSRSVNRAYELGASFACKPLTPDAITRFAQEAWLENSGAPHALSTAIQLIAAEVALSAAEALILTRAVQGHQRDAIILERGVSANTHRKQVSQLLRKMGESSLVEAANRVLRRMVSVRLAL